MGRHVFIVLCYVVIRCGYMFRGRLWSGRVLVVPKQAMLHNVFYIKMLSTNLFSLCCARVGCGCTTHIQRQASALRKQHDKEVGAVARSHFSDDSAKIAT